MGNKPYILWFDEVGLNDLPLVGGKNASLGEMRRELTKYGVNIPNGFAVTTHAYHAILDGGIIQEWHEAKGKPNKQAAARMGRRGASCDCPCRLTASGGSRWR